ncbi:MAG TPA: VWA domain-containing protein, partial [Candidatus Eisenbacteria bacterium]|nr:VWA domain-containing protein [Candidatus Eisenbacteria bacterium]
GRYALIAVTPPAVPRAVYHRDLTILIDASGSMTGEPIETAKRIATGLVASLDEGDRFEILAFASNVRRLTSRMEPFTADTLRKITREIGNLQAGGGTEMQSAIQEALASLRPDSQHQIVIVTDGEIGFENEIMETLSRGIPAGVRLHAVGVGAAPNRTLTFGLARGGRGLEVLVPDTAEAEAAVERLRVATSRPVLTDLVIGGSAVVTAAPARPRDVFAGQPVVIAVEVRAEGGTIEVGGRLAGSAEAWGWRTSVGAADASAETVRASTLPIGALFGRERIADVEAGIGKRLEWEAADAAIEALGLRHRIVSRRTSLVAVAEEPSVDPLAPRRRERLAVELPFGVSAAGVGLEGGYDDRDFSAVSMMRGAPAAMAFGEVGSVLSHMSQFLRGGRGGKTAPAPTGEGVGTLIRVDGDVAVIEIEVPYDGFRLPKKSVMLTSDTTRESEVEVIGEESSPAGPHKRGTVVRLALRVADRSVWTVGNNVMVRWNVPGAEVLIVVEVPAGLEGTK